MQLGAASTGVGELLWFELQQQRAAVLLAPAMQATCAPAHVGWVLYAALQTFNWPCCQPANQQGCCVQRLSALPNANSALAAPLQGLQGLQQVAWACAS
jgi:hypothetical protein